VARQTYDFERADSLLSGLLARSGTRATGLPLHAPSRRLPLGWLAAGGALVLLAGGYLATRRSGRMTERSERASGVVARTHQR
jgi:hypothetical protein